MNFRTYFKAVADKFGAGVAVENDQMIAKCFSDGVSSDDCIKQIEEKRNARGPIEKAMEAMQLLREMRGY